MHESRFVLKRQIVYERFVFRPERSSLKASPLSFLKLPVSEAVGVEELGCGVLGC